MASVILIKLVMRCMENTSGLRPVWEVMTLNHVTMVDWVIVQWQDVPVMQRDLGVMYHLMSASL